MADQAITVSGNITRAIDLRYTQGGKGVASFGLAVSHRFQRNGEWEEKTSFFNVTAWDKLGENCAQSLAKGNRVIVTGRIEVREYEGRDGDKRTSVDIIADDIGPSLKWANTVIERVTREGGTGNVGRKQRERDTEPAGHSDSYDPDEEPFLSCDSYGFDVGGGFRNMTF